MTLSSVHLATESSIGGTGNLTISSAVSGAGLTKVGAGTLTLSVANAYSGTTATIMSNVRDRKLRRAQRRDGGSAK